MSLSSTTVKNLEGVVCPTAATMDFNKAPTVRSKNGLAMMSSSCFPSAADKDLRRCITLILFPATVSLKA